MSDPNAQKPEITYPCQWDFKVIGTHEVDLRQAITSCLQTHLSGRDHTVSVGRTSSGGKYISLKLSLRVESESERDGLFTALSDCPDVKMLI